MIGNIGTFFLVETATPSDQSCNHTSAFYGTLCGVICRNKSNLMKK
jgi:hypothetical protein